MKNLHKQLFIFSLAIMPIAGWSQAVAPQLNIPATPTTGLPLVTQFPDLVNYSNTTNRNYIRQFVPQQPVANSADLLLYNLNYNAAAAPKSLVSTIYYDGLGRPLQEVGRCMSGTSGASDMVTVHAYDVVGREATQYLPFNNYDGGGTRGKLKTQPLAQVPAAFNTPYPGDEPYAQTLFDNSPLQRPTKVMAAGHSWVGTNRGTSITYRTNDNLPNPDLQGADNVRLYTIGYNEADLPQFTTYYNPGELIVTDKTDEDGHITTEYKDKFGRVVCQKKNLSFSFGLEYKTMTYYVYDDLGRLRYVLSPQAAEWGRSGITQDIADGLCYRYWYDERGRLIEKKLPGKDVEYIIYNSKDLPILSQDGNLRNNQQWNYTIYDALNRPVYTGLYNNYWNRNDMAYAVQVQHTTDVEDIFYYLDNPSLYGLNWIYIRACDPQTYNYYDYAGVAPSLDAYQSGYGGPMPDQTVYQSYANYITPSSTTFTGQAPYCQVPQQSAQTRGKLTASFAKVSNLDNNNPYFLPWIQNYFFYDIKGQTIQQHSVNHRYGLDITYNQYDFAGTLISSEQGFSNPLATSLVPQVGPYPGPPMFTNVNIAKRYTKNYTNGLISMIEQNMNNTDWRMISSLGYDEFNRLKYKNYSPAENHYDYNIRGWLTGINQQWVDKATVPTTPDAIVFCEALSYDNGFRSKYYNGNIAGIRWRTFGTGATTRSYAYSYDKLDRLTYANFTEELYTGAWQWGVSGNDFTASNISYDYNGNLMTMNQKGPGANGPVDMDMLTYYYKPNSNQLQGVTDAATAVTGNPDFKDDPAHSNNDYSYDYNGNLTNDGNGKNIGGIGYNYLDKPTHIEMANGIIDYAYDGVGNKLQKRVYDSKAGTYTVTDYIGPVVYENNEMQLVLHEEGRCRPQLDNNSGAETYYYDYFIKDHLGNVRTTLNTQVSGTGPYIEVSPTGIAYALQYKTGMEVAAANTESIVWDHLDDVRSNKPASTNPDDVKAAELNAADPKKMIGPAMMLRVLPGDRFDVSAQTYYDAIGNDQVTSTPDVVNALIAALTTGVTHTGMPVAEVQENVNTVEKTFNNPEFVSAFNDMMNQNYDPNKPATFLNYMVFDENMNLIRENSGTLQMDGAGGQWNNLNTNGQITIGQTGYLAIFANTIVGSPSFVDQMDVTFYKGTVLEENHYYPFGLTLSANTQTKGEMNNYKLTTKELQPELGLNWYDFGARMYDEQIGRWNSVDEKAEKYVGLSPYCFAGNMPTIAFDLDGRSITIIGEANQKIFLENVQKAFGNKVAANFYFKDNVANYSGKDSDIKGKNQKKLFEGLKTAMSENFGNLTINYNKNAEVTENGGEVTKTSNAKIQETGAAYKIGISIIDPDENVKLLRKEIVDVFLKKDGTKTVDGNDRDVAYDNEGNPRVVGQKTGWKDYGNSVGDRTFHAIGHFIDNSPRSTSSEVNRYENYFRVINGENPRPEVDENHPKVESNK